MAFAFFLLGLFVVSIPPFGALLPVYWFLGDKGFSDVSCDVPPRGNLFWGLKHLFFFDCPIGYSLPGPFPGSNGELVGKGLSQPSFHSLFPPASSRQLSNMATEIVVPHFFSAQFPFWSFFPPLPLFFPFLSTIRQVPVFLDISSRRGV